MRGIVTGSTLRGQLDIIKHTASREEVRLQGTPRTNRTAELLRRGIQRVHVWLSVFQKRLRASELHEECNGEDIDHHTG